MTYFANGSAGEVLDEQCCACPITIERPCPIALIQQLYNYKQVGNDDLREAMDVLVKDGLCQMKPLIEEVAAPINKDQAQLFDD